MLPILGALGGIGSIIGGLSGLFGGHKNPAKTANDTLDTIPGQTKPYYQPYMDAGSDSLKTLKEQYDRLTNDPGGLYSDLGKGYKESPGYQFKLHEALGASQNASAAGGMLGTPYDQGQATRTANDVASQDFNDYIKNIMGLYGEGLTGNKDLEHQGFDANTGFANLLSQITGQKAHNDFEGQAGENRGKAQSWSDIVSGIGSAATGYQDQNTRQKFIDWLKSQGVK